MAWSKESRQSRGYGAAWDKVRKVVLARDCGLCQVCKKAERITIATQVDHIVSKARAASLQWPAGRVDEASNLQSICRPCHEIKTEAEQGKRKHAHVETGPDGWPTEKINK